MKNAIWVLLSAIVTVIGLYLLPEDLNLTILAFGQMVTFFFLDYDVCPFSIRIAVAALAAGEVSTLTLADISVRLDCPISFAPNQHLYFVLGAVNVLSYCIGSVCGFSRYQNKHSCSR